MDGVRGINKYLDEWGGGEKVSFTAKNKSNSGPGPQH